MSTSVHPLTVGVATASAGIIMLGLWSAPPAPADTAVSRTDVIAVQLAAVTSVPPADSTPTPAASTSPSVNPAVPQGAASAATDPVANLAQQIANVAGVGLGLLIAPFWLLSAPITLPLALATGAGGGGGLAALVWLGAPFFVGVAATTAVANVVVSVARYVADLVRSWLPSTAAQSAAATRPIASAVTADSAGESVSVQAPRIVSSAVRPSRAQRGVAQLPKPLSAKAVRGAHAIPARVDAKATASAAAKAASASASGHRSRAKTAPSAASAAHGK